MHHKKGCFELVGWVFFKKDNAKLDFDRENVSPSIGRREREWTKAYVVSMLPLDYPRKHEELQCSVGLVDETKLSGRNEMHRCRVI